MAPDAAEESIEFVSDLPPKRAAGDSARSVTKDV
jgi:hypothetical protein